MPKTTKEARKLFHEGCLALSKIEANGVRVDETYLENAIKKTKEEIILKKRELENNKVFQMWKNRFGDKANLGSKVQLGKVVFSDLGFDCKILTETKRPKVDETVLADLDHPFLQDYLYFEKLKKAKTNLEIIRRETVDGFVHPSYNLNIPTSFRSGCQLPNWQNQYVRNPKLGELIRRCFIPRPHHVMAGLDYCLSGNTEIETIDGKQTIKDIVEKVSRHREVYCYSYNQDKKRICVSRIIRGKLTRKNAVVWKVTLDNGKEVIATPDHSFMLRDGSYKKLKDLRVGDSLMPFYKKNHKSWWGVCYDRIHLNNGEQMLAHNLIALDVYKTKIAGSNKLVHHRDGNGKNNSLENLEIMTRRKHMRIHAIQSWTKPKKKRTFAFQKSKEGRELSRQRNLERKYVWTESDWKEFGRRVSEGIKRKGGRKGNKNSMFGRKQTKATKEKISKAKLGKKTGRSWCKGLTKETSYSVYMISLNNSISQKKRHAKQRRLKKKLYNHTIKKIEPFGKEDVYNINVEKTHNYALAAGIIVKNCGIEVKCSACVHGDPVLIEYIKDETKDMHRDMAAECYFLSTEEVNKKSRYCAKNMFVFPQFYGSYYIPCAKALWEAIKKMDLKIGDSNKSIRKRLKKKGITSLGECDPEKKPVPGTFEHHIQKVENDFWNRRFQVYNNWKRTTWEEYQRRGWVKLLTGFVINGLFEKNQILNFPIQSIAFHCDLQSVIWFQKWLEKHKMRSLIIGEVHDSIDGDVHEDELDDYLCKAKEIMTEWIPKKWTWINVPLSVEAEVASPTRSIFDKKPYKFLEN